MTFLTEQVSQEKQVVSDLTNEIKAKGLEHNKLVAELKAIKNKVSTIEKEKSKMQSES